MEWAGDGEGRTTMVQKKALVLLPRRLSQLGLVLALWAHLCAAWLAGYLAGSGRKIKGANKTSG